jgi:hypothetical protein
MEMRRVQATRSCPVWMQPKSVLSKRYAGVVMTDGLRTVTVTVTGLNFQPVFDLGGLMRNNGLSLNIALNPSVTMRYLLTTPCV